MSAWRFSSAAVTAARTDSTSVPRTRICTLVDGATPSHLYSGQPGHPFSLLRSINWQLGLDGPRHLSNGQIKHRSQHPSFSTPNLQSTAAAQRTVEQSGSSSSFTHSLQQPLRTLE
mmetsp:Transcript_1802/g.3003  ORF Transcript_1802/g.3003 Transcript_1802/m.3003 type:complete len:116 (+) Transcript_1802:263-610(+)